MLQEFSSRLAEAGSCHSRLFGHEHDDVSRFGSLCRDILGVVSMKDVSYVLATMIIAE